VTGISGKEELESAIIRIAAELGWRL